MVKNHSDRKRENPLQPLHGLLFPISSKGSFHRQDSTYHDLCYISRGAQAGMRNIAMGPPWGIDPTTHRIVSGYSTTNILLKLFKNTDSINRDHPSTDTNGLQIHLCTNLFIYLINYNSN